MYIISTFFFFIIMIYKKEKLETLISYLNMLLVDIKLLKNNNKPFNIKILIYHSQLLFQENNTSTPFYTD